MEKLRKGVYNASDFYTYQVKKWLILRKKSIIYRKEIKERIEEVTPAINTATRFWTDILRRGSSIMTNPLDERPHENSTYEDAVYAGFEDSRLDAPIDTLPEKQLRMFSRKLRRELRSVAKTIATYNPDRIVQFGTSYPFTESLQKAIHHAKISLPTIRLPFEVSTMISPNSVEVTLFRSNPEQQKVFAI